MPTPITKKEFADLCGVSQCTLSNWIRDGIVGGEALVGEGVRARVDTDIAMAQIRRRLDPGQSMGEGRRRYKAIKAARAGAPTSAPAPLDDVDAEILAPPPRRPRNATATTDPDDQLWCAKIRYAEANAEKIELQNATARRELLPADQVVAGWAEILTGVRSRMLAVPSRVRALIGTLTAEDVEVIASEIRRGLKELADAP